MGRIPRDTAPGSFHLIHHAIEAAPLFADEFDFRKRLDLLADAVCEEFRVNQFVLMDNHEHAIVTVEQDVLPAAMHDLNRSYARWFNTRHARSGHVYAGPYGAIRIEDERHAQGVVRYLALNPEGLRYTAETYPFSSYRSLVDGTDEFPFVDPAPVLEWFGGGDEARERIRSFVDDGRIMRRAAAAQAAAEAAARVSALYLVPNQVRGAR